jgi:hypothetical protein
MEKEKLKNLMHACFMYLLSDGSLSSEKKTFNALRSILEAMVIHDNLSEDDYEECIVYFYEDYSKGCNSPIPETYVRETLVPAIKNYGHPDLLLGASILFIAKSNI